jgi:hypothetical protein
VRASPPRSHIETVLKGTLRERSGTRGEQARTVRRSDVTQPAIAGSWSCVCLCHAPGVCARRVGAAGQWQAPKVTVVSCVLGENDPAVPFQLIVPTCQS